MMEHLGYAAMTETPLVLVDVQRGGPSTGLPTLPGQGDMMQARWGSHGDYEIIALCPNSPQECFDLMIDAFNLAEEYRTPVLVMMDECVGHMTEKVVIPAAEEIKLYPRRYTSLPPSEYLPFRPGPDGIPEMAKAGEGYRTEVTGLTHDEKGYPAMNWQAQKKLVGRLVGKIRNNADRIARWEEHQVEDADVVVVAYGITSRVARAGRADGAGGRSARGSAAAGGGMALSGKAHSRTGRTRPLLPGGGDESTARCFMKWSAAPAASARTELLGHGGGMVHEPEEILQAIREAATMSTVPNQSRYAFSAHGPHAAHLVSGLRHRHHGELLCPGAGGIQAAA